MALDGFGVNMKMAPLDTNGTEVVVSHPPLPPNTTSSLPYSTQSAAGSTSYKQVSTDQSPASDDLTFTSASSVRSNSSKIPGLRRLSNLLMRKKPGKLDTSTVSTSLESHATDSEMASPRSIFNDTTILTDAVNDNVELVQVFNTASGKLNQIVMNIDREKDDYDYIENSYRTRTALVICLTLILSCIKVDASALTIGIDTSNAFAWLISLIIAVTLISGITLTKEKQGPSVRLEIQEVNDILLEAARKRKAIINDQRTQLNSQQNSILLDTSANTNDLDPPSRVIKKSLTELSDLLVTSNDFNRAGFRLNCFADLPNLDFGRDVLNHLPPDRQNAFLQYEAKFNAQFDPTAVKPYNVPDRFTLLRFLQADKYDADRAIVRMNRTTQWREQPGGLDEFIDNVDLPLLRRSQVLRPRTICGFDKHKRLLLAEKLGEFFSNDDAYRGISIEDWIKTYAFEMSIITNAFRVAIRDHDGPYQHRIAFIGDLAGIRFMQAMKMIPMLQKLVKEVENHFPEFAGVVTLINAPAIAVKLFAIVKKFLDPATAEKITVLSHTGTEHLSKIHGIESVPVEYGGQNPVKVLGCPKMNSDFEAKYPYVPKKKN